MRLSDYKGIIKFYISYIKEGKITLADVPTVFQEEVLTTMEELKGSEHTHV